MDNIERKVLGELNRPDPYTSGIPNPTTPTKSVQTPPVNQLNPVLGVNQSTPIAPAIRVTEGTPSKGGNSQDHTNPSIAHQDNSTAEGEGNLLVEEAYASPASGLSFLTEQLGNCNIKDALSSDDEAFQECQSFTSSKGLASNPDSRALTPVNFEQIRVSNQEFNATFETTNTQAIPEVDLDNKTFELDSGLNSTETVATTDVEYGTEVLEDFERLNLTKTQEVAQLNVSQPRSPLAELSVEEIVKADACRTSEIESVIVESLDTVTTVTPDVEKTVVTQRTEENTVEVSGQLDPLEEFINSNTIPTTPELKPENTPLPPDDFDDLPEENQENIPPVEVKINSSVTDTITVVDTNSPVITENTTQDGSTFEEDTAIFVGGKLNLTNVNSFDEIPVKGVSGIEGIKTLGQPVDSGADVDQKITLEADTEISVEFKGETDIITEEAGLKFEEYKIETSSEDQVLDLKKIEKVTDSNLNQQQPRKVLSYQESFDERPIKGVSHSESLAAFEKIEAEINSDTKNFETPLTVEVEELPAQTAQEKADLHPEEPTFIVGTMPESKGVPMDVDEELFDFPPPPKEMLDEIEQTSMGLNKTESPLKMNGSNHSDGKSEVFVEDFSTNIDTTFKMPNAPIFNNKRRSNGDKMKSVKDDEFRSSEGFEFSASDFDYLDSFENKKSSVVDRSSLLLKFDPLLKQVVPDERPIPEGNEELAQTGAFSTFTNNNPFETSIEETLSPLEEETTEVPIVEEKSEEKVSSNETMSITSYVNNNSVMKDVKIIEDGLKSETIMSAHENTENMSELDKKVKNEVLKSEELEKKLEEEMKKRMEAEQKEEQLLKRIVEKEKAYTKLQNIVAEYEKAISEMITEKEQIIANEQRKYSNLHADSETNAQHLASLETTFSDLHIKYERTKQMAMDLKDREAILIAEKRVLEDSLKTQEQRYEKMKNHAVQQLENANMKLSELVKNHNLELTKLRAQLKKEEISRASIQEQLLQKSKENEELVKICDELINGSGGAS